MFPSWVCRNIREIMTRICLAWGSIVVCQFPFCGIKSSFSNRIKHYIASPPVAVLLHKRKARRSALSGFSVHTLLPLVRVRMRSRNWDFIYWKCLPPLRGRKRYTTTRSSLGFPFCLSSFAWLCWYLVGTSLYYRRIKTAWTSEGGRTCLILSQN